MGYFGADVLDVKPVTLLGRHLDGCSGDLKGGVGSKGRWVLVVVVFNHQCAALLAIQCGLGFRCQAWWEKRSERPKLLRSQHSGEQQQVKSEVRESTWQVNNVIASILI